MSFHGTSLGLLRRDKRPTLKKKRKPKKKRRSGAPPGIDGDSFTRTGLFLHCALPVAFVTRIPLLVWSQALGCQHKTSFSWIKCVFIPSGLVSTPTMGLTPQLNETEEAEWSFVLLPKREQGIKDDGF